MFEFQCECGKKIVAATKESQLEYMKERHLQGRNHQTAMRWGKKSEEKE